MLDVQHISVLSAYADFRCLRDPAALQESCHILRQRLSGGISVCYRARTEESMLLLWEEVIMADQTFQYCAGDASTAPLFIIPVTIYVLWKMRPSRVWHASRLPCDGTRRAVRCFTEERECSIMS